MNDEKNEIYDRVSFLLNEVEARLDEGFPDEGLQIALQAHRLLDRTRNQSMLDLKIDTHYLLASCHFELRDISRALREYQRVRALDDKDPEINYWEARALFHTWRFEEARSMLKDWKPSAKVNAAALYYQALTHDFLGEHGTADQLFQRAEAEDPTEFPRPFRLPTDDLQGMLNELLGALPDDVGQALDGVAISLLPLPAQDVHASPDVDPLVLGLYRGQSMMHRDPFHSPSDLDRIEIFQRNVERVSADPDELREEMRVTLLHEIGHHLGWDEGELTDRGLN